MARGRPETAPAAQAEAPDAQPAEVVLVSAMRNEAPFILEWIAYHRAIGVDRFVICSNGSTDGTDELLAALDAAGVITFLPISPPARVSPQREAVMTFETRVGYREGDWYLWLDADEFLNVHVGDRTIGALIKAMGKASALMLNWRLFGSGGNATFPGRFISDDFVGASSPGFVANLETKPLFRRGPLFAGFSGNAVGLPRLTPGAEPQVTDCLAGKGKALDPRPPRTVDWLAGRPIKGRTNLATRRERGWVLGQVNHYSVRTPDFFRLKAARGRGSVSAVRSKPNVRHTQAYFDRFDLNDAEDRTILHWQDTVTAGIDKLLQHPGVAQAAERATVLVKEIMSELDPAPPEPVSAQAAPDTFKLTFPDLVKACVHEHYQSGRVILEYGSGGSTVLAAKAGCHVISVESDRTWADRLTAHLAPISDKAKVHYADIGPTGAWGVPMKVAEYAKFHSYALSVWDRPDFQEPDLVLIDGRFRASCLVAVLLRAKRPTTVLFDDYARRRYYHGVEKLARKEETVGRMARFTVVPGPIPPEMMTQAIGWFVDPR